MTRQAEVVLADLGIGNVRSVERALLRAGATVTVTGDADVVAAAPRLVVPGQGGFADCAKALRAGLGDAVMNAIGRGAPYLGICLGMQMLFEGSEEAPDQAGLALFPGSVRRIPGGRVDSESGAALKVPHMGWNEVRSSHPLLVDREWFYFTHSYHCCPDDESVVAATTDYGIDLCAAVGRDNVFACQFHPEKSQGAGERLLARFLGGDAWS